MMRKWFAICLVTILCLGAVKAALAADKGHLNFCYTEWGPFGGNALPGKGAWPDLVSRIFNHAGYRTSVKILPWARCLKDAGDLKYDLVSVVWKSASFEPEFAFARVVSVDGLYVISTKSGRATSGKVEDLKGLRVAILKGQGGTEKIYQNKDQFQLQELTDDPQLAKMLNAGRVDVVVTDPTQFIYSLRKHVPQLEAKLKILEPPVQSYFSAPMISKKHPKYQQIIEDFNRAFPESVEAGVYQEIESVHGLALKYE